jgi:hypothetical protein
MRLCRDPVSAERKYRETFAPVDLSCWGLRGKPARTSRPRTSAVHYWVEKPRDLPFLGPRQLTSDWKNCLLSSLTPQTQTLSCSVRCGPDPGVLPHCPGYLSLGFQDWRYREGALLTQGLRNSAKMMKEPRKSAPFPTTLFWSPLYLTQYSVSLTDSVTLAKGSSPGQVTWILSTCFLYAF